MSKYNLYVEDVSVEAVFNKLGGTSGARRFLRGETVLTTLGSNILSIDRSVRPTYPEWAKLVMHPELENTGPAHIDLAHVILYLHPVQKKDKRISGEKLYSSLKETGLIEHCLDLRFGEELKKNPHLFPEEWKGKTVFLWQSVVRDSDGDLDVPYVYWRGGEVVVHWYWLGSGWDGHNPAGLSAS